MGRGLDGSFLILVALASCVVVRVRGLVRSRKISGGSGVGETPLPIPNREVKPHSADGTWLARAWESRSPPVSSFEPPLQEGRLDVVLRGTGAARPAGTPVLPGRVPAGVHQRGVVQGWRSDRGLPGRRAVRAAAGGRRRSRW